MSTSPTYLYKLIPSSSPVPLSASDLPVKLPVSKLDQESEFIHLSTSVQVPNTLKLFFAEEKTVYVLRLPYGRLEEENLIKWEDPKGEAGPRGGEGVFPHLYNGLKLGQDEVDSIKVLEAVAGSWDKPIEDAITEKWFVY
ncbi:hypothetical protein BDP27DRAFT_1218621 [Rhodocollybia butyracea]|uniref:Uncharacterized protein n=1 Tax=Rhodocollybia butyracea TaxID=206335 RepID=A0A9P5UAC4_9AGAR|nr:hypothetical protein BDP27DRAFT_1218621 [Rhodocollybia butyracea]